MCFLGGCWRDRLLCKRRRRRQLCTASGPSRIESGGFGFYEDGWTPWNRVFEGCYGLETGSAVKSALKCLRLALVAVVAVSASPALAVTDIMLVACDVGRAWGGRSRNSLPTSTPRNPTTGFVPHYKGNYTETVTRGDLRVSFRTASPPSSKVNEIATRDHDGGKGGDLSGVRPDGRPAGGVFA